MKTKLITLFLAAVMLLSCIGCSSLSADLVHNGNKIENDFFSVDVTGLSHVDLTNYVNADNRNIVAYAANSETDPTVYLYIDYKEKDKTLPTRQYYETDAKYFYDATVMESGELTNFEDLSSTPHNGLRVDYTIKMKDGSIQYIHRELIRLTSGKAFLITFYDTTGDVDAADALYTSIINGITIKEITK